MKPRLFFSPLGRVIRTRPAFRWPTWLWPANGVALVIALYAWVAHLDDMDDRARADRAAALAQARAEGFEAGRRVGEEQMLGHARAAWQMALTEGEERCQWRRP